MLINFETKSNRVKGLSFHPKRPWILASLHNGTIQLWDYRMGTLLEKFEEHDGPVRGIHFHSTQPLFVSGGDDYKIKVWNYKQKRCLFTLLGHLDYIRTVQFHKEHPWVISASDDQTIRIWNWQSRSCISVITGHNHYVMCASFHPTQDLVVSASLDQRVRVWDISGLVKKARAPRETTSSKYPHMGADFLGSSDVQVKHVLEGHDRGVNWAAFHHSFPLIVSGADDRQVKLWRMSDTKAWEVDTLRGHVNNVSCVLFHPKQELIISNSEDKSIRVWDIPKRSCIHTHRREHDRFWIQATHPDSNILAAGHDSGLMVFKLERERPAFQNHEDALIYVKDKFIKLYEYGTQRDTPLVALKRAGNSQPPRFLHFSAAENTILLQYSDGGGSYELYKFSRDAKTTIDEPKRGSSLSTVFVTRNKFASIESNKLSIRNTSNELSKVVPMPIPGVTMLFPASTGALLLRSEEKIALYDTQQQRVLAELACPNVKYVFWSRDGEHVALMSKHTLTIASKQLEHLGLVHETIRLKSGAWDESGVFVYSTLNHMKFCLTNGDNGTIRTLDVPIYITKVQGDIVHCLDRDGQNKTLVVDSTEFMFKSSLQRRDFAAVRRIIQSSRITGHAIIGYLQRKGFPEVALHFVKDEKTRFNLALQCGNIEVAKECAGAANDKSCWERLGQEALLQGKLDVVEEAYQRTESFERLSFLYLITGQTTKLRQMLEISKSRGDVMSTFHNALLLGDVEERVRVLSASKQTTLAYLTAFTHDLTATAETLAGQLSQEHPLVMPQSDAPALMMPPVPLNSLREWPLLNVSPSVFDLPAESSALPTATDSSILTAAAVVETNMWGDENDIDIDGLGGATTTAAPTSAAAVTVGDGLGSTAAGWGDDIDVDIDVPDDVIAMAGGAAATTFVAPRSMPPKEDRWSNRSRFVCDQAAAADYDNALSTLHLQIGAVNFEPFKAPFFQLWTATHTSIPCNVLTPSITLPLLQNTHPNSAMRDFPPTAVRMSWLVDKLKAAYAAFGQNNLAEASDLFVLILTHIPLLKPEQAELPEINKLKTECREYIVGIKLELARRETMKDNLVRATELACYFTHCSLQPPHMTLALKNAMGLAFRLQNYVDAAGFAQRLLERAPPAELAQSARKVLAMAETNKTNQQRLNYDMRNPFVVCGQTMTPIFKGSAFEQCPFCGTFFSPEFKGKLCTTCNISKVGFQADGLFAESRF